MKKQVYNPFLPLNEYIPDGEPHVFGERVYLYGSHDAAGSDRFCVRDYTVWSAPVDDLSDWSCHGVSYQKSQDLRAQDGRSPERYPDFYAPDCVRGKDGRYYLYYVAMGPNVRNFGPMSVAVSDSPAGPFEYLGDICNPDGTPLMRYLTNDPAVLNDGGRIWLYYGWGFGFDFRSKALGWYFRWVESLICKRSAKEIKRTKPSIMNCVVVELEDDMLTVKGAPKPVLHSKDSAPRGGDMYRHPFFEAASIRKFGELYYLVYSSGVNNELAYATSAYPDRDFEYRGVIISNSDLGLDGNTIPKAPAGTIHGGMECINGQYYIFYHRCTHGTDFSRQACAEPIEVLPDGSIKQAEISSCGLNGRPLAGRGTYPAAICCNLYTGGRMPLGLRRRGRFPQIMEKDGAQVVAGITDGTTVGYKYFDLPASVRFAVKYRGTASGRLEVRCREQGNVLGTIPIRPAGGWSEAGAQLTNQTGRSALFLTYHGRGTLELLEIALGESGHEDQH